MELPSTILDLVHRLEGQGEPMKELPDLSGPEFLEFFPTGRLLLDDHSTAGQVRSRVLKAIGSCNTFEYLNVEDIFGGDISRLTAREWDVVFRGFRSSTVLRMISVYHLKCNSEEVKTLENLCLQLGRILESSSVTELKLYNCRLSARCFAKLASEVRGSSSKLQYLELEDAWEDSSAVKHVADIIESAPLLETLRLGGYYNVEEDETVGILSQALIKSSSLKELDLGGGVKWGAALLLKALAGDDGNRSIERVRLWRMDRIGDFLKELFSSSASLKEVELPHFRMRPEEVQQLGEVIRDNSIATTILAKFDAELFDWASIEALARSASSDVKDPTLELELYTTREDEVISSLNLLGRVLCGEIKSVKSLSIREAYKKIITFSILPMNGNTGETSAVLKRLGLSVRSEDLSKGVWEELLRCMRGNHLTHLDLSDSQLDEEAFRDLMGVLQGNHLTHLDLSDSQLHDEAFRDLMGVLQVNLALQEIDVSRTWWESDGKAAQIQQALQQNKERAVYMSVFREANLTFGDAKAGRLFLCGCPRAGKTQLRQTLMRINQGKSWLDNKWEKLSGTKGIEVEFLVNNDNMQISVWDFAGQWIFRTLQTVLFSQTYNFCVFLFVYSTLCEETSSTKPESCFRTELEEWLSFITSSTKVTGRDLPQVIVVISHKDKFKSSFLSLAHPIVEELTKRFTKFVDLRPIQECFYVDARKKKQVSSLNRHIIETFHKLLSEKSPQVPELCLQLTSLLITNTKENKSFPLWTSQKFYDFCVPTLKKFIPSLSAHLDDHSKIIFESIISYLNDVGSIIYIPNLDYIIVDPNWLTNTFLGELIALGQNFQAQEPESSYRMSSYASKDGFVSEVVFAGLIEKFLRKQPRFQHVDRKVLENILINLDFCFKLEDSSQYFIPSFIPEHASKEEQNHGEGAHAKSMDWENRGDTPQFVGIRIQCKDERTMSLTAAFFPRFQMFMRRKLISEEMGASEENVICSRHYLRLFHDGHQIYIEHVQSEKYSTCVDVLMLCSSQTSKEKAITYVRKHIVQELISFCASPKGCPGVVLVFGLIQTFCVEMLIPIHLRTTILIEKLKLDFKNSINEKLEEMPVERSHLMEKEELFHYEHCWPPIRRYTGQISELARDLLWESDVDAVVNEIRQERIEELKSLQEGLLRVDNDLTKCYPEAENMVSYSNFPQMKDRKPSTSRYLSRASTSVENRSTRLLLFNIDPLEEKLVQKVDGLERKMIQKVDSLDERLRSVNNTLEKLEMKMGHILSVQQELQSTLIVFMSKVDRIIGYSQAFQQGNTPKRPYVTDDVGYLYRLSAGLHVGTIVRLHLMCESVTGFHFVKDQEGLKLRLDLDKWGLIRKTIEISYKVIYYAAKAALTKFCKLGDVIPAWADLESDIVKLDVSSEDRKAVLTGGDSQELQDAWLRIQQILAPELQNRYSKIFKLYQVKYVSLEKGRHAWVCEKCMSKGLRCGILTC
ncbi:hypothetical protein MPTK2_8g15335 [Marchantia polymorpha subsp. ruderalis]